jgi:serine/threonine protein kinase
MNSQEDPKPGREAPAVDDPRVVEALEEYLTAAEEGQAPDRRLFLARHADISGALAECLDGLAALHGAGPSPSQALTVSQAPDKPADGSPGRPLGDFRIIRELGRGGMGVVYEAEQLSLGRRVALKVLSFAAALDSRQLQRFKNEAQAAAHLHHQHIVPVHAVGCERGVHYYAMQLIEGQNLAAVVAGLRRREELALPSASPGAETPATFGARLSTQRSRRAADFFRTVVRLVAQAAEALDYAHGMGVVHRDVKPANLLIDDRGNLWVADFGLASFHAGVSLTQTGDLLGTLRYMSPEQANGNNVLIDHRTDIYSLGATLYELLALRPIFDGADRQRLLHQILNEEPRPPRLLDPAIPPELETIVLKAVSKSPTDRYATAREFADDLHRFLDNQPIRARRPSLAQRVRKWGQRHPAAVAAAVGLLLLVAVGSLVSTALVSAEQAKTKTAWEKAEAEEQNARAAQKRAEAEEQKAKAAADSERRRAEQAEQRLKIAREAVEEIIQVAEAELIDRHGMEGVRNRLLELALRYNQRLIEEGRDDPDSQAELEMTQAHVERILADLTALQSSGQFGLLNSPDVLNDLRASRDQRTRIASLYSSLEWQLQQWLELSRQHPAEERTKPILKFAAMAAAREAGAKEILTAEQLRRLRQIDLQVRGAAAFRDPDVAAALKLTDAQKERIRAIEGDRLPPPGRRGGPGGPQKPPPRLDPETRQEVLKLLTDEQRARWHELAGEPFRGRVLPPGPHPRPPPGPG